MKKANKKLASAIVLGLMLAVPVGASAEVKDHYTENVIGASTGSGTVDFADSGFDTVTFEGNAGICAIEAWHGGTSDVKNIQNIILAGDEWRNGAFYALDGGTINITEGVNSIKTDGTYNDSNLIHSMGGVINIDVSNVAINNVVNAIYSQRIDSCDSNSEVNIVADGDIILDADWSIVAANYNDEGNDDGYAKVYVDGSNVTINANDGYAIRSQSKNYSSDESKTDKDFAGKTIVEVIADNNLVIDSKTGEAIYAYNGYGANDAKVILKGNAITVNGDIVADKNAYVSVGANDSNSNEYTANITGDITATDSAISIDLGKEGSLTGAVVYNSSTAGVATLNNTPVTNGITINMGNGSVWNVTGNSSVSTITGESGTIRVENSDVDSIIIGNNENKDLTLSGGSAVTNTFDGNNISGSLQDFVDIVDIQKGEELSTVTVDEGDIIGKITASLDENGNIIAGTVQEGPNVSNQGISEMASIGLMAWRAENNDMNKRMGELRNSNGEHGVWARMVRGESEYGSQSIKNVYNTYQLGYDEKLSTNDHWTVGAAISYTDGQSSFATGSGENTSKGLSFYGSYLGDNGEFVDLIAKYARLDNEFDVAGGAGSGDYSTNGYSFSAEFGKRNQLANDFYFEPQVELTYGRVADVDYVTSEKVKVSQDSMDSLVGRVGFAAGKNIKNGNVYVRASYLYDFDGETSVSFAKNNTQRTFEEDLGGGWFEFGIGTNINLSDATYLYLDVEKTTGGEVDTNWQWNAGVRYSF